VFSHKPAYNIRRTTSLIVVNDYYHVAWKIVQKDVYRPVSMCLKSVFADLFTLLTSMESFNNYDALHRKQIK
jgi:hypothetical protein